jgi:hypothetical protein
VLVRAKRRFVSIIAVAALLTIGPALADKPSGSLDRAVPTEITGIPIDFDRDHPERKAFGKLIFRGGLSLYAKTSYFGGYSALAVDPSGNALLAVSDAGTWLRSTIDYNGRLLKGLSHGVLGPLLDKDGKPLADDAERDSEGLTLIDGTVGGGTAYVSFERDHRILRYPFTAASFGPPDGALPLPSETKKMDANRGIEALAAIRTGRLKGTLVAFSERLVDRNGNLKGWLIGGPTPGPIALKRIGGFDLTDAAPLPGGGIVVLERRFRYSEGVKMRIRRIAEAELKRGTPIEGETLLEADENLNIDNMEGIAAHRSAAGETILTLISDDNFSPLQRTLLLQFALADTVPALAGPPRAP